MSKIAFSSSLEKIAYNETQKIYEVVSDKGSLSFENSQRKTDGNAIRTAISKPVKDRKICYLQENVS